MIFQSNLTNVATPTSSLSLFTLEYIAKSKESVKLHSTRVLSFISGGIDFRRSNTFKFFNQNLNIFEKKIKKVNNQEKGKRT